jgi:hypothetical protein
MVWQLRGLAAGRWLGYETDCGYDRANVYPKRYPKPVKPHQE